ncbi:MAG TPA: hypothetical protein VE993_05375 [Stellaceae bacterium]|nr:hypothetical protein [Stellaceae bacterium]
MIAHTAGMANASRRYLLFPVLILIALGLAGAARAQDARLAGRYAFTGTVSCLYALGGFARNGVANSLAGATSASFSSSGVLIFDGAGQGSGKFMLVGFDYPPSSTRDTQGISMQFNYSVASNGEVDFIAQNLQGRFFAPGPLAGTTFTIDQIRLHGWLAASNRSLTLGSTRSNAVTLTYANGTAVPGVCAISEVLLQTG